MLDLSLGKFDFSEGFMERSELFGLVFDAYGKELSSFDDSFSG